MSLCLLSTATETRQAAHAAKFTYDTDKYSFRKILEDLYGTPLEELHLWLGEFEKFERSNDQLTIVHRVFYSNYERIFKKQYESFINEVVKDIVKMPFAYQKIPTFRIGLPGNRFVGEFHLDSHYHHPDFELNFNVGLSNYKIPACLVSEPFPKSKKFEPIECEYGELFSFNHIDCVHGAELNSTNQTTVSFDFRLAMMPFYDENSATRKSVNMNSAFSIGDYFSSDIIN